VISGIGMTSVIEIERAGGGNGAARERFASRVLGTRELAV